MSKRKIQLVTGSRGEWGYIRPIIKLLEKDPETDYDVVATNMHLLPEFGYSIQEMEREGIKISDSIPMALAGYNNATMSKSLGVFLSSYVDTLNRTRPDIVLLAGDRGEQLMACTAAAYMNIPVAHIQAGEVSGNVDGAARHAITKLAHLHFAATEEAYRRLIRMGEQKFRCFQTGAPQLDDFLNTDYQSSAEIRKKYRLGSREKFILMLQHSVTYESHLAHQQMNHTLWAVKKTGLRCILIWPNNDAGSSGVQEAIKSETDAQFIIERNVSREIYGGLLATASVLVGNSSSALIEAPSFKLPAVNIGNRQRGRERGINIIDVSESKEQILKGIQKALSIPFRKKMRDCINPYGDGKAAEKIVAVLKAAKLDTRLLEKTLTY